MKITMYELLGMVKDGKAPKKIKFENCEYYFCDNNSYLSIDETRYFDKIYLTHLNIKVEILEEEKKMPEKIPLNYADDRKPEEVYEYLRCSYNQLIDYLKSKGE